ncbi:MAG: iron-sulfur cluster repair di-iron protein [Mariniblastus sp.]|nr:iron-sulfur cluster repair di-iron protein [Mariniblastus sp.]
MNQKFGEVTIAVSLLVLLLIAVTVSTAQDATTTNEQSQSESDGTTHDHLWTKTTTIGQIVADRPQTARVFELVEIDYCCGGQVSLEDAALEKRIKVNRLLAALSAVGSATQETGRRNWQKANIGELMDHIVARHHTWLRRELPPLVETTKTVHRVHGRKHTELKKIADIVAKLPDAILPHLAYEEQTVFPAIKTLATGNPVKNIPRFLEEMRTDHDQIGEQLHELRKLTGDFLIPEDACAKYREMLTGLEALERDLHIHVHLENNILLSRALKLAESANDQ